MLGVIWSFLGNRSSRYLDRLYDMATWIESRFPAGRIRPFIEIEAIRMTLVRFPNRLTSSTWIVTWIPVVFAILLLAMMAFPWLNLIIN